MFFRMIYDEKLAEAAYLVGCQRTGEALLIDPQRDIDRYLDLAARQNLKITAVTETHIHADFLSGCRELAETIGARVYLSDEGDADWKYGWLDKKAGGGTYDHRLLRDGDTFTVGNIEFRALHTPGHTPEHLCFLITDRGGGAGEPMGVATGDFVFVGDLGRPDLLETAAGQSGAAAASARRLFHSVRRFRELPDYLQVWPGHGAGSACGKALGAVPQSTVGYEKRFCPAIRAATSEEEFSRFILGGQPEPPLYFARMKRDNRAGPRLLGRLPQPPVLDVDRLAGLDTARVALVDTRTWDEFRAGHVPGALYLPLNDSFTTDAGSLIGEGEEIYLIVPGAGVEEAVRGLVRIGLDNIAGFFEPSAVAAYQARGGRIATVEEVDAAGARRKLASREWFLLDVRRQAEFDEGHIERAVCMAHTRLASRLEELPGDRPILVNCRSGGRSARACALLQRRGFRVANLAGGMEAWSRAGGG
jgi:hydroxyacylglutathione hydrolase